MDGAIGILRKLGFGQYEAQAYITLLQSNPVSGYELARVSGVPRANIYAVLDKLEQRGALLRDESSEGTRYTPVEPEEFIGRLRGGLINSLETAQQALSEIAKRVEREHIWNAQGYPALLEHARSMIDASQQQLLAAVWPQEARLLSDNLARAQERQVATTTLCLAGCARECGHCRGQVFRTPIRPETNGRWLVIVPDGGEVLAGEIGPGQEALAVRTRQKMLVCLVGQYVRQNIALAVLLQKLGDHLEEVLDPDALAQLNSASQEGSWMGEMKRRMRDT